MADIGGIQLLPEARKELEGTKRKGENRFLYISIAILSLVVVLGSGLVIYKMSLEKKIYDLNQSFLSLEQRRDKKAETNLKILSIQISTISDLIKNHIFLTKAFDKIGSLMDEKVQVSNFSIAILTGKISLKARALNYPAVARQMASFLSDGVVKDISLGNMSTDTKGNIEFGADIIFDKVKLLNK